MIDYGSQRGARCGMALKADTGDSKDQDFSSGLQFFVVPDSGTFGTTKEGSLIPWAETVQKFNTSHYELTQTLSAQVGNLVKLTTLQEEQILKLQDRANGLAVVSIITFAALMVAVLSSKWAKWGATPRADAGVCAG